LGLLKDNEVRNKPTALHRDQNISKAQLWENADPRVLCTCLSPVSCNSLRMIDTRAGRVG
jgi:hypothetical protein